MRSPLASGVLLTVTCLTAGNLAMAEWTSVWVLFVKGLLQRVDQFGGNDHRVLGIVEEVAQLLPGLVQTRDALELVHLRLFHQRCDMVPPPGVLRQHLQRRGEVGSRAA